MKIKILTNQKGSVALMAILFVFVCVGISFSIFQIRQDMKGASAFFDKRLGEHQVLVGIENYFKDNLNCSQMLSGKRRGDLLLDNHSPNAPKIGKEWKKSGWIVKDLFLLRAEDAKGWAIDVHNLDRVHLKVSLVPKPVEGIKVGMDYLLNAPASVKIISLNVIEADEKVFSHCRRQLAQQACQEFAHSKGSVAKMDLDREPASLSLNCAAGVVHQVHCLVPHSDAPIWRCNNRK
ncbi:MAG: hypothetical protein K2P81_01410 [Bacteriovoracaceae bacterium]|nr:hypothetical protein [Bacteriovoracaceae bacterium]